MKTDPVPIPLPNVGMAEDVELVEHDEIAARAYELYLERGREDGHDLEDWLEAEKGVIAGRTGKAAA